MGQGEGRWAGTSAGWHGLGPLTSGSSCSTTYRCQNPRSVGDTGVRKTSDPSSLTQACFLLTQAPAQTEPWTLTHPLHKALCNAPCTAAALQVLQELAMGRRKSEGLCCSPVPPRGGLQKAGSFVAANVSRGCHVQRKVLLIATWDMATCSDFLGQHPTPQPEILSQLA